MVRDLNLKLIRFWKFVVLFMTIWLVCKTNGKKIGQIAAVYYLGLFLFFNFRTWSFSSLLIIWSKILLVTPFHIAFNSVHTIPMCSLPLYMYVYVWIFAELNMNSRWTQHRKILLLWSTLYSMRQILTSLLILIITWNNVSVCTNVKPNIHVKATIIPSGYVYSTV